LVTADVKCMSSYSLMVVYMYVMLQALHIVAADCDFYMSAYIIFTTIKYNPDKASKIPNMNNNTL
jgi:hypothetical protein